MGMILPSLIPWAPANKLAFVFVFRTKEAPFLSWRGLSLGEYLAEGCLLAASEDSEHAQTPAQGPLRLGRHLLWVAKRGGLRGPYGRAAALTRREDPLLKIHAFNGFPGKKAHQK